MVASFFDHEISSLCLWLLVHIIHLHTRTWVPCWLSNCSKKYPVSVWKRGWWF